MILGLREVYRRFALFNIAVLFAFLSACAQTAISPISQSSSVSAQNTALATADKPDRVLVYDFVATPRDVKPDSALGVMFLRRFVQQVSPTEEEVKIGREVANAMSAALVTYISNLGIPAERAYDFTLPTRGDFSVEGQFITIDEGNRLRRIGIGLGAGASEVKMLVQLYDITRRGRLRLEEFEATAKSGRKPGIAETMPAGAAVRGAAGIATAGGIAALTSSRESVEADARHAAKTIAKKIAALFATYGWISNDQPF
ncbi:MAG: DUF4410 domain-containing protein [Deltaproteobacteria bacterium]|nr:DUF4410 domain-containing protein [Deltaproteobacteria bacterium]